MADDEATGEPRELDVWQAANLLLRHYGRDAPLFVAMRAEDWLARGDLQQYNLSKRIMTAIEELMLTAAPSVH